MHNYDKVFTYRFLHLRSPLFSNGSKGPPPSYNIITIYICHFIIFPEKVTLNGTKMGEKYMLISNSTDNPEVLTGMSKKGVDKTELNKNRGR